MKKTLLTLALTVASVAAFAQGKVTFVNDSLHNYYISQTAFKPADAALAGQATPLNGVLPSGVTLRADLYAGTSSSSLSFVSSTTLSGSTPGRQNTLNVTLPFAGPTAAFFQVQIRDQAFATADLASAGLSYFGKSMIFTVQPSTTIAFNSIVNHGGTALSTWTDGPFALGGGQLGSIEVKLVPEPSSMALAGLGAASLLLFRRRK